MAMESFVMMTELEGDADAVRDAFLEIQEHRQEKRMFSEQPILDVEETSVKLGCSVDCSVR